MIRYDVTEAELVALVNALDPNWLSDAAQRTERFRQAGKYDEAAGAWSRIKDAFIQLQRNKCAYCERKLSGPPEGRLEHDVEHYRPKSEVKAWPTPAIRKKRKLSYSFPTGDALDTGYFLLAYSLFNYATACKTCNSSFKSSYFPIAQGRGKGSDKPRDYRGEGAFIPYPIDRLDEDPERIVTFEGILPVPAVKSARSVRHRRARVTIDFFQLDLREELLDGRARVIDALWFFLEFRADAPSEEARAFAGESVDLATAADGPHASCARAFVGLYERDRARAELYFREAHEYLRTKRHPQALLDPG